MLYENSDADDCMGDTSHIIMAKEMHKIAELIVDADHLQGDQYEAWQTRKVGSASGTSKLAKENLKAATDRDVPTGTKVMWMEILSENPLPEILASWEPKMKVSLSLKAEIKKVRLLAAADEISYLVSDRVLKKVEHNLK